MRVTYFLTHPIQYQSPLIRYLRKAGVELEVVYGSVETAHGYYDPGFSREVSWGVPLLEGYPHRVLPETRGFRQLVRVCRESIVATGAEAVWIHGWGPSLSRAAWLAARQCHVPILLRGESHLGCVLNRGARRLAHQVFLSLCFRSVRHFLAIGAANREFYQAHGVPDERITTMPYAVDNAFFQARCAEAAPHRETLRMQLGLPSGQPVVLFCGKLIPEKSPQLLVEAFRKINPGNGSNLQPSLIIAGDGRLRTDLEAQSAERAPGLVRLPGFVDQTGLPALYDLCDLFVLPSEFEPWGVVVNEAMNAAKPVIVSDRVGSRADLVRHGVNGSVFQAGNVAELRRAMETFLSDVALRQRAGEESLRIINHWSFAECLDGLDRALDRIAPRRAPSIPPLPAAPPTAKIEPPSSGGAPAVKRHRPKVAFIFTHQIQYFTNVLDELHQRGSVEMLVIYAHQTARLHDVGFERVIEWDNRTGHSFRSVQLEDTATKQLEGFTNSFSLELFRELRNFDPDVVHLNGYSNGIQWQGWMWALLHRKRIILRGDGDTIGVARSKRNWMGRAMSRGFTRFADHVFFQGEENRRFWLDRGARPGRLSWIPCVSDNQVFRTKTFASDAERDAFRSQAETTPAEVAFVVSGKLDARKRPADALQALSRLADAPCKIWFLGSGPLEKELRSLAGQLGVEDRVFWWGFRNQTEIPRILQAADVLLHLSEQDPWPYSVLEGAMSGLPLLLSDRTGSHPDLIAAAGAGDTFVCGDIGDLCGKMKTLAGDTARRKSLQDAAISQTAAYSEISFCEIFERTVGDLVPAKPEK